MKKFIFGFVLGAFFFGSISMAATKEDKITIQWDIDAIRIDGKEVVIKKKNPPFSYNGVAYIPSYVFSGMEFTPSRTPDGKTVLLTSKGTQVYPSLLQNTNDGLKLIGPNSKTSVQSNLSFVTNSDKPFVANGKSHDHYTLITFKEKEAGTNANTIFSFALNNEYKRFSMTGSNVSQEYMHNNEPVVLKVYVMNLKRQESLYGTYTFRDKKAMNVDVPLKDVLEIKFEVSNISGQAQEFAMLSAAFTQ